MRFSDEGRASSVLCQACGFSPRQKLFKKNAIPFSLSLYICICLHILNTYLLFECIRKLEENCEKHSNAARGRPFKCSLKTFRTALAQPRNCPNPPLLLSHLRVICGGVVRCWQLLSQRAVGLTSSQLHQVLKIIGFNGLHCDE